MKKFIATFSIFLFLAFNLNSITAIALPKSFSEGLYKVKDTGLTTNIAYKVKNASPSYQSVVIIYDGKNIMQELLRLDPNSPEYFIKPLDFDYKIIVVGNGEVQFY
jgi:hypothetical protein